MWRREIKNERLKAPVEASFSCALKNESNEPAAYHTNEENQGHTFVNHAKSCKAIRSQYRCHAKE